MAFQHTSKKSGKVYFLHGRKTPKGKDFYFFAGDVREGALENIPADMTVVENERTGLPMLKRKG